MTELGPQPEDGSLRVMVWGPDLTTPFPPHQQGTLTPTMPQPSLGLASWGIF
jgi:hypothetical protein